MREKKRREEGNRGKQANKARGREQKKGRRRERKVTMTITQRNDSEIGKNKHKCIMVGVTEKRKELELVSTLQRFPYPAPPQIKAFRDKKILKKIQIGLLRAYCCF